MPMRQQTAGESGHGSKTPAVQRLLVAERRRRILELLDEQERVTVNDLARRFRISAVTARGDLDALANTGRIVRSHGGALRGVDPLQDLPLAEKERQHHAEKVRIGRAAAALVRDNETIILDSGTTAMEVARALRTGQVRGLTVITNALTIALELGQVRDIGVIVLGGMLRPESASLVGPSAERALRGLNADRLFLGVDGFDLQFGLSTPDVLEAHLNAVMIQVSREVTVVADASKLARRSLSAIAPIKEIHRLVTDRSADGAIVKALKARKVDVVLV